MLIFARPANARRVRKASGRKQNCDLVEEYAKLCVGS